MITLGKDINGWHCTDHDSAQYLKKVLCGRYKLIEAVQLDEDTFMIHADVIDVNERIAEDPNEVEEVVRSYEYTSVADMRMRYGDAADALIAECLFETDAFEADALATAKTFEMAELIVEAYIAKN